MFEHRTEILQYDQTYLAFVSEGQIIDRLSIKNHNEMNMVVCRNEWITTKRNSNKRPT